MLSFCFQGLIGENPLLPVPTMVVVDEEGNPLPVPAPDQDEVDLRGAGGISLSSEESSEEDYEYDYDTAEEEREVPYSDEGGAEGEAPRDGRQFVEGSNSLGDAEEGEDEETVVRSQGGNFVFTFRQEKKDLSLFKALRKLQLLLVLLPLLLQLLTLMLP